MSDDLVRVSDRRTGHQYTTSRSTTDADPTRYRILRKPAVDGRGFALPPKTTALPLQTPPAAVGEADSAESTTTEADEEATS